MVTVLVHIIMYLLYLSQQGGGGGQLCVAMTPWVTPVEKKYCIIKQATIVIQVKY